MNKKYVLCIMGDPNEEGRKTTDGLFENVTFKLRRRMTNSQSGGKSAPHRRNGLCKGPGAETKESWLHNLHFHMSLAPEVSGSTEERNGKDSQLRNSEGRMKGD